MHLIIVTVRIAPIVLLLLECLNKKTAQKKSRCVKSNIVKVYPLIVFKLTKVWNNTQRVYKQKKEGKNDTQNTERENIFVIRKKKTKENGKK